MAPLTAESLHGVWGSVLLPVEPDDRIDWRRLDDQLAALCAAGLHGLYAHGTAGELHTLSETEFDRINAVLADTCTRSGTSFQIGASHPIAPVMIDRVRRAKAFEPDAFQVILPDWLPLGATECLRFLTTIAEAADPIPLVLYNPPHAKTPLSPELARRLLDEIPALIGFKLAAGDDDWYTAMRAVLQRSAVFIPGHRMATGLAAGARGSYSNIAALSPTGAARWYALCESDPEHAGDIERRIGALFDRHIAPLARAGYSNPALDKFLAAVGDWSPIGLRVRWPYADVPAEAVAPARRSAAELLPELFEG